MFCTLQKPVLSLPMRTMRPFVLSVLMARLTVLSLIFSFSEISLAVMSFFVMMKSRTCRSFSDNSVTGTFTGTFVLFTGTFRGTSLSFTGTFLILLSHL